MPNRLYRGSNRLSKEALQSFDEGLPNPAYPCLHICLRLPSWHACILWWVGGQALLLAALFLVALAQARSPCCCCCCCRAAAAALASLARRVFAPGSGWEALGGLTFTKKSLWAAVYERVWL